MREVLVVTGGDEAVERRHGERRVAARLVAALAVGPARRRERVDDPAHAQRLRHRLVDLPGLEVAALADAGTVGGLDVLVAGGQARACAPVAEDDRGDAAVVRLRDVLAVERRESGERIRLVP